MTLNWRKVSLIIAALGIVMVLVIFNNNKNDQQEADESILLDRYLVARTFILGTFYDSIEDPIDITLYPTDETQPIMDRWKIISDYFPEFEYPEEYIKENSWVEVNKVLHANYKQYSENNKDKDNSSEISLRAIKYFLFENDVREDSPLEKLLEEKGIDYEKE
jgi:hypothetical protein